MKNTTRDLNNHLMAQIERLSDENLSEEDLQKEVVRSEAICRIGKTMIDNNRLVLDAAVAVNSTGAQVPEHVVGKALPPAAPVRRRTNGI